MNSEELKRLQDLVVDMDQLTEILLMGLSRTEQPNLAWVYSQVLMLRMEGIKSLAERLNNIQVDS